MRGGRSDGYIRDESLNFNIYYLKEKFYNTKGELKMKIKYNRFVNILCILIVIITTAVSVTAMASTSSGIATIKANGVTTTIGDVTKAYNNVGYSTIFCKRSAGQSTSFAFYVWVRDTTNSTTLSNKVPIVVSGTSKGTHIKYKSGVSYKKGDNIRFYGSQASSSTKGLSYTIYGDKAVI